MRRRDFITLLGGAATAWPLGAQAQQNGMPVIGILGLSDQAFVAEVRRGLAEAGYVPGQNVMIELRLANNPSSLVPLAAELVDRKVDVIVTVGSPYAAVVAKNATSTIPIVFSLSDDPVKYGPVSSLSRPGGNVTGMTLLTAELDGKRLNILRELIPQATTIAYLSVPESPISQQLKSDMLAAGRTLGREIIALDVSGRSPDFKAAFTTLVEQRASALIVGGF